VVRLISTFVFGAIIGSIATYLIPDRKNDGFATIRPSSIFPRECVLANEDFQNAFYHLGELYKLSHSLHDLDLLGVRIAIEKKLSRGFVDHSGRARNWEKICKPKELYETVERALADKEVHPTSDIYQLELYAKLENPSDKMLDGISKVAFRRQPYYEPVGCCRRKDPRPIAMTILAQQGERAKPYAPQAYNLMDHKTPLGTSAAQVVAAVNYADSLSKIESMMFKILEEAASHAPLDFNQYERFKELSYALMLSGDAGKRYTNAIETLMDRKIYVRGGLTGRLETDPKYMCSVMDSIYPEHAVTERYEYCSE